MTAALGSQQRSATTHRWYSRPAPWHWGRDPDPHVADGDRDDAVGRRGGDGRLVDTVLVTPGMEVARLCSESLRVQDGDARDTLVLITSDGERARQLLLGIAEAAHSEVNLARTERGLPVLRVVGPLVPELPGTRGHPDAKRLGETLQ